MARSGSFGGSLNPFGTGSIGSFSQYDIASNLAELELYRIEVAWGNGTATDEEYLASLRKALEATSPDTRERESAFNRLADVEYRIGRSRAESGGLDALIAFDQAALGGMNPDNLRYRSIADSLDAEMAQRRSRDYGVLVDRYNAGDIGTEDLVNWVESAIAGIDPSDPDYTNWLGTRSDLRERVKSEADATAYQDYQMGRMEAPEFLAYITGRRDEYSPESPSYDEWARKVEDATKQIKDTEQAKADTAFFNLYELGKVSDKAYLAYLDKRIDGMAADDPDRPAWQQRLTQAAFGLAEDQLRFAVDHGKAPVSKLVAFYKNYQKGLNPGSAEWRTIDRALDSLKGYGKTGGGGGGTAATTTKPKPVTNGGVLVNAVMPSPMHGPDGVIRNGVTSAVVLAQAQVGVFSEPPPIVRAKGESYKSFMARKKERTAFIKTLKDSTGAQEAALSNNIDALKAALANPSTRVWLYQDPRKPGTLVAGMYPDGTPMLDSKGKPIMVLGAAYLTPSNDLLADLYSTDANMHYDKAKVALAAHDSSGYNQQVGMATASDTNATEVRASYVTKTFQKRYDALDAGIDLAMKTNDLATAWNLALQLEETIQGERVANPFITAERQKVLDALSEKLGKNPLLPQIDPFTGQRIGGAIDLSNQNADGTVPYGALLPGWHFVLGGADERGVAKWGLEQDTGVPGEWESQHVVVHTTYGGKVVTGEVKKKDAPVSPTVFASVPGGRFTFQQGAQYITYTDEHGQRVDAYSLDGQTWIRSLTGAAPALQINTVLTELDDNKGGKIYTDSLGKTVLTTTGVPDASGKVVYVPDATYLANNPGSVDWYGMGDLKKHEQDVAKFEAADLTPSRRTAEWLKGNTVGVGNSVGLSVGAPGQKMQVIEMSDTGQLNLTGQYIPPPVTADSNWRSGGWRAGENDSAAEAPWAPSTGTVTPGTIALGDAVMRLTLRMRAGPDAAATGAAAIKAQLPANTPPRYDGVGFNETRFILPKITPVTRVPVTGGLTGGRLKIVTAPPPLKSLAPQRGLATATRASLPPAPKRTTPPRPKQPPKAPPKRPTPKPKAPPKPKPTALAVARGAGTAAKAGF